MRLRCLRSRGPLCRASCDCSRAAVEARSRAWMVAYRLLRQAALGLVNNNWLQRLINLRGAVRGKSPPRFCSFSPTTTCLLQRCCQALHSFTMSVTLHTTLGDIKIEVFCESVPKAAEVSYSPFNSDTCHLPAIRTSLLYAPRATTMVLSSTASYHTS